jgi:hypothetical protein
MEIPDMEAFLSSQNEPIKINQHKVTLLFYIVLVYLYKQQRLIWCKYANIYEGMQCLPPHA